MHAVCRCGLIVKFKRHLLRMMHLQTAWHDVWAVYFGICRVSTRHVSTYGLLSLSISLCTCLLKYY